MANTFPPAPTRQPQYDRSGNMTPAWVMYYQRRDVAANSAASSLDQVTAEIDALQASLDRLVATTREIRTKLPLTGGGDLSADRTLAIQNFQGDAGRGGEAGAVPAPNAGDAAAKRFLSADGTWSKPAADANVTAGYGIEVTDLGGAATEITAPALVGDTPRDFTDAIEDLRSQVAASGRQPRDFTDAIEELKANSYELNALGFQQQLDELRVQLASVPTPAPPTAVDANGALLVANNLDDLDSVATARTNLGLGTAALDDATAFLQPANNLNDVSNAATALANLVGSFQTWTPTLTASGSMTISGASVAGRYVKVGSLIFFTLSGSLTAGGTPSYQVYFSLPAAVAGGQWCVPLQIFNGGSWYVGTATVGYPSLSEGSMARSPLGTNFALGSIQLVVSGIYET